MYERQLKWGIALLGNENFPKNVRFLDTTLRDGEQTPGVSLTPENKLRIAKRLDELGVNVIEAGFAASSEGEIQAIKAVAKEGLKAEVCSMARGVIGDLDAILKSEAQSVHLVIPSSDLHLQYKLKKSREEVLAITEKCVQYAKDHGLIVELSGEDSTRADFEYVKQLFQRGIDCGADRLCPCDTVGILTPERAYEFFSKLNETFRVPISVHCHNDFGMAVANSIEALRAGAVQVHATINGLGERAGNAALEEVVMTLASLYNHPTAIKTQLLFDTSRLVSRLTGVYLQPNKAIVGDNAFAHESGIHTHGILQMPSTYEAISPELVGMTRRLVPGKHAGSHGVKIALQQMGLEPKEEQLKEIMARVKALGDKGKQVTDSDLQVIAEAVMGLPAIRPIKLEEFTTVTGDKIMPTASVRLTINGNTFTEASVGIGPVDAAINAIKRAVSMVTDIQLDEYHVKSITGGTNALVEVVVRLRRGNRTVTSTGARGDIVMASVEAVLSGMNLLLAETGGKLEKQ